MVMTGCTSQNDTSKEPAVDLLPLTRETSRVQDEENTDLLPPSQEIAPAQNETYENSLPSVRESTVEQYELSELEHAYATIGGMSCPSCAVGIEYSLKELEGATDATVSYENANAEVIYNPTLVSKEDMEAAIDPYTLNIVKTEPATSYSLN